MNIKTDNIMSAIHLTKDGFENRIVNIADMANGWNFKGDKPAIIDFYASWCGPCQRLSPIIDELSEEYAGKVDIYKIDVDDQTELAKLFRVRTIPTLVYIPMGETPIVQSGGKTKGELRQTIESLLLK